MSLGLSSIRTHSLGYILVKTISFFSAILILASRNSMAQESNTMNLRISERQVMIRENNAQISLRLKLTNRDSQLLKVYSFYNEWSNLCSLELLSRYAYFGLNLVVYDKNGDIQCPLLTSAGPKVDLSAYWGGVISADSAITLIKKRYGDTLYADWKAIERKKVLQSRALLLPSESIETNLNIDFERFDLEKGEYKIVIYYVCNERIFEFVNKEKNIFIGYIKSNEIRLIVN